jgi:hypothetical protein
MAQIHQCFRVQRAIHNFGKKLTLGLTATITLGVVLFLFPALLPFSKCILEVVFCEGDQHCLRFCLDHLGCVKMVAFQSYLESGKQRKAEWVGDDSYVVFGHKFLGAKKKRVCDFTLHLSCLFFSVSVNSDFL